jgi:hypothetical protein
MKCKHCHREIVWVDHWKDGFLTWYHIIRNETHKDYYHYCLPDGSKCAEPSYRKEKLERILNDQLGKTSI